jgi:hypothetical protein
MALRQRWLIAFLAVVLCSGGFPFEAQRRGNVEAVLEVSVAARGPAPGLAAATYRVQLTGPASLEAAPPRLEDAASAWKTPWQSSAWSQEEGKATVEFLISLQQKKGKEPLPDLRIRFREGPEAAWEEVDWRDILWPLRDPPGPPVPVEPGRAPWLLPVIGGVVVLLAAAGFLWWRRRRGTVAVEPWARALAEIDRLDHDDLSRGAAWYHTRLSQVIRTYVAERFGLRALEQTTAEFLDAAEGIPELAAQAEKLRELCEWSDLAKFAGAAMTAEECRHSGELARALIESTRPLPPAAAPSHSAASAGS